ncbi:MAG: hypothetical protein QOI61_1572 [Actinomycetota bacterium]|jgi:mRNA-degrading endonuclease toxin of MazEF toxin-antitoxin module
MSKSVTAQGQELIDERALIDTCEAAWLSKLVVFDASGAWQEDGHATCAAWLVGQCGMSRRTAMEKLRVAHELVRRPVIAAAFSAGEIAYEKARVLSRLEGIDEVRDARFVRFAEHDTADVLERRVQRWNYEEGEDKEPSDLNDRRGWFRSRGFGDGMGRIVIEAPDDELDRAEGVIDAYLDHLFHQRDNPQPVDERPGDTPPVVVRPDAAPTAPSATFETAVTNEPRRTLPQRRVDAFLDLVEEVALVRADQIDPERACIGVTVDYQTLVERAPGSATLESGRVISGEAARRLACDAGMVRMIVAGVSEILDVGRKTRTWPPAMRRAIRARHNHRCAFPACERRITQIHHIIWWENGGFTAVINGVPLCSTHHRLVHEGKWTVNWNPTTGITRFEGPHGQILESTSRLTAA